MHKHEDSSRQLVCINISPGFKHADPNKTAFLERASEELWTDLVKEMVGSGVNWQLITSYNEWGEGTSVESALDWQTESGFGMYLDVLHNYATPADLTTSLSGDSGPSGMRNNLPFAIVNNTLHIKHKADQVTAYSMNGKVILQARDVSDLVLEFKDPIVFLTIQLGETWYRYTYVTIQ
jgi:hypothetical protein